MTQNLLRRSFLRGLSALPLIGGAAAVPSIASAFALAPTENPDLLELGRQFDVTMAEWDAATDRFEEASQRYDEIRPDLPEGLHRPFGRIIGPASNSHGVWTAEDLRVFADKRERYAAACPVESGLHPCLEEEIE